MIPIQILGIRKNGNPYLKTIRKIESSDDIDDIASQLYYNYTVGVEMNYLIMFDYEGNIISIVQISAGCINYSDVSARNIVSALVLGGAVGGFSLIHNHVSNIDKPSKEDIDVVNKLKIVSSVIEIDLYASYIATKKGVVSY